VVKLAGVVVWVLAWYNKIHWFRSMIVWEFYCSATNLATIDLYEIFRVPLPHFRSNLSLTDTSVAAVRTSALFPQCNSRFPTMQLQQPQCILLCTCSSLSGQVRVRLSSLCESSRSAFSLCPLCVSSRSVCVKFASFFVLCVIHLVLCIRTAMVDSITEVIHQYEERLRRLGI
jgi:hypothetical protein